MSNRDSLIEETLRELENAQLWPREIPPPAPARTLREKALRFILKRLGHTVKFQ